MIFHKYKPSYKLHVTFKQIPNLLHTNAYLSVIMIVRHLTFYQISRLDFLTNESRQIAVTSSSEILYRLIYL